jgi:hypothetical protein
MVVLLVNKARAAPKPAFAGAAASAAFFSSFLSTTSANALCHTISSYDHGRPW